MNPDKKLIIDEDWKSQVAAEKEAAERSAGTEAATGAKPAPTAEVGQAPEASFAMLVTVFVTEAMVAMGQLPHPASGELSFNADHARYAIDMLEVITEKTRGNLSPAEERELREVLHQLRMAFVALQSMPPTGAAAPPGRSGGQA